MNQNETVYTINQSATGDAAITEDGIHVVQRVNSSGTFTVRTIGDWAGMTLELGYTATQDITKFRKYTDFDQVSDNFDVVADAGTPPNMAINITGVSAGTDVELVIAKIG